MVSLNSRLESNKEEEEELRFVGHRWKFAGHMWRAHREEAVGALAAAPALLVLLHPQKVEHLRGTRFMTRARAKTASGVR